ncbi:glyoxalase superfamily protein [Rhizobium sp. BK176]|uniref:glyoxalase superfamily protein n=1 Tax=Rhizobium sp. BK176 TaxID=2587071 RepID=UPI0021697E3F|nr:glyoxalase superfamily protein [Rhizobium sp. BK176]MCS4089940.1 hypothetical protein [Rhizobium sp. BK176]
MSGMHQHASMTSEQAKSAAKNIKSRLKAIGVEMSMGHAYEALAGSRGYANWSTMKADLRASTLNSSIHASVAVTAIETLKEKLREAVRAAPSRRKHRQLFLDVKRELHNTLHEATSNMEAVQTLMGTLATITETRDTEAQRSFAELFRGYLGKQLIPEIGDTIAEVFAEDTKDYLARTLIAVELLICDSMPSDSRRSLLVEELSFEKFMSCTNYIMSNERITLDSAKRHGHVVRFATGEIDAMKASEMILSITHLLNYGPRLAFETFMEERSKIIGRKMAVIHRANKAA